MTAAVVCKFSAAAPTGQSIGSITLTDCSPSISNEETLSSMQVIFIVLIIVILGLVAQWVLHHINRKALHKLRTDLVDLTNVTTQP
jgi:sensor histidine kinase regulating citrate/malate metabolism